MLLLEENLIPAFSLQTLFDQIVFDQRFNTQLYDCKELQ